MKLLDVINSPWAILPDRLREIQSIYETHLRGEKIDIKSIEAKLGEPLNNTHEEIEVRDGVAVIPIHGVIGKRLNLFSKISGGVSTELLKRDIEIALSDDSIESILLDIDSPGGAVDGTQELANFIFNSRGTKPIIALANGTMASAAYWIGAAAHEVYMSSETTVVGSIGVVATHTDVSKAEEKSGIKTTEIVAGHFKRVTSELAPLTEAGREDLQSKVDFIYSIFVSDVAKFKGVSVETVLEHMADGRVFIGSQSIEAGLVDGVSTIDDLITDMSGGLDIIHGGDFVAGQSGSMIENEIIAIEQSLEENEMNTFKISDITVAFLSEHCPDVVALIADNGVAQARDAVLAEGREIGHAEGLIAGVEQETQRVKDVEATLIPGHEALVNKLKFDGKTTGPEAAVQVINAEKAGAGQVLADIKNDSPKVVGNVEVDAGAGEGDDNLDAKTPEERWEASEKVRAEYGTIEAYKAYLNQEAKGNIALMSNK